MADGFVRIESRPFAMIASPATARHLLLNEMCGPVLDLMEDWPRGVTYALPAQFTRDLGVPEEISDLVRGLQIAEVGDFAGCVYGPCVLPAVTRRDGFSLCEYHDSLLTEWMHLVA